MSKIEKIAACIFGIAMLAVIGMAGSEAACANIGKLIVGTIICIILMAVSASIIAHEENKN